MIVKVLQHFPQYFGYRLEICLHRIKVVASSFLNSLECLEVSRAIKFWFYFNNSILKLGRRIAETMRLTEFYRDLANSVSNIYQPAVDQHNFLFKTTKIFLQINLIQTASPTVLQLSAPPGLYGYHQQTITGIFTKGTNAGTHQHNPSASFSRFSVRYSLYTWSRVCKSFLGPPLKK